jgi:hypothetical protein
MVLAGAGAGVGAGAAQAIKADIKQTQIIRANILTFFIITSRHTLTYPALFVVSHNVTFLRVMLISLIYLII